MRQTFPKNLIHTGNYWLSQSQMLMRKQGVSNPYERIKEVTRGTEVTPKTIRDFVAGLEVDQETKKKMYELSPSTYIGLATRLVEDLPKYTSHKKK